MSNKRFLASNTRNVCILAHVDHGKTSLADSLLAANNIVSTRMAGKVRYLDSRDDEQERGITMESSAVSLSYRVQRPSTLPEESPAIEDYIINLIDTPGHVDFSSEVSTASRLCDGALVLVDAVEGVCTQTISVLKQAWTEQLKPILVINKIDRLITELRLAPIEAHHHLIQLVEQVNAVMGGFFASERLDDEERWHEERAKRLSAKKEATADLMTEQANQANGTETPTEADNEQSRFDERDDEDIYFAPETGNVIFASAIDGWAFRINNFSQLHARRLGIKEANLRQVLWGDFYLDPKNKRVLARKHLAKRNLKPMFVQFVLENIWAIYENVTLEYNAEKITKIITALGLKIKPQDLKAKERRTLLSAIFSQWLPIAPAAFRGIVEQIPAPREAQEIRLPRMLHPTLPRQQNAPEPANRLESDLYSCNAANQAHVIAYVSKMFAIPTADLPQNQRRQMTAEEMREKGRRTREAASALQATGAVVSLEESERDAAAMEQSKPEEPQVEMEAETLIGFARLYSGSVRVGQKLYAILPKYNSALPPDHESNKRFWVPITVSHLYMMMGRDLVPVEEVPAGNVFGVGGLEGKVVRSATLCASHPVFDQELPKSSISKEMQESFVNLAALNFASAPIVRVALEPEDPSQMPQLVEGLRLLNQSDPCVETLRQETGEHVILTAGELHLERCLKDLRERFAKIKIQSSPPIVPFRETAISSADLTPKAKGATRGISSFTVLEGLLSITISARPLPSAVTSFLSTHQASVRRVQREKEEESAADAVAPDASLNQAEAKEMSSQDFNSRLSSLLQEVEVTEFNRPIRTFGPRGVGPNILFDIPSKAKSEVEAAADRSATRAFFESIDTAFQIATLRGPLCAEPVEGMAFFVESLELRQDEGDEQTLQTRFSQVTGGIISQGQEAFGNAFLDWSPRLLLAMYSCDIQASTDVLGKVYGVVARRRGRIVSEEMKEGTTFFTVRALLPVVESFGFAEEIRKRTSGAASPQLVFHGFEMLDQDPFWVPTTEEELEDLGDKADRENVARRYMDRVRKRKGLAVVEKIVEFAEKQRTMKR